MKKISLLLLITLGSLISLMAVPPHPNKTQGILNINQKASQNFGPRSLTKRTLPQNVLVLRCQFPDKQFISQAQYPDYFPHNTSYFDKYMTHVKDYFLDASSEKFNLNYTIWPNIANLNKNIAYYGDDKIDGERRAELAKDVINALDNEIDYSQYDAFIIFHAGAGQESDIFNSQASSIWSTFLTKSDFRESLDPNNINFQGIPTQDNTFISEAVISPESERHPDFPQAEDPLLDQYDYSMLGVLIHQFAHQLGLPTLFDNYSANGSSSGIGNFGLMGTAVWNNNGKTPCLPSAWSRYYMGWNNAITINSNADSLIITYPMDKDTTLAKLYKIPISDKEYFLIENRQNNNRIDSIFIDGHWEEKTLHTFDALPDSIQDFYPETNIPIVNLLENSLRGSEWDFFLPYMYYYNNGGDYLDPSGILIWHIDENIIDANFTDDFEKNRVNGDALHKGVDLEEADGIQHLDFTLPDNYMRGSPKDSFRADRNNYFGKNTYPNSDSYYGASNIEITNISNSANHMSFNVRFNWHINFNAESTHQSPFVGNLHSDGNIQKIYFADNADLFVNSNGQNTVHHSLNANDSLLYNYTLNPGTGDLIIPTQSLTSANLMIWNDADYTLQTSFNNYRWANQILALEYELLKNPTNPVCALALNSIPQTPNEIITSKFVLLNNQYQIINELPLTDLVISNLSYKKSSNFIYFLTKNQSNKIWLNCYKVSDNTLTQNEINTTIPSTEVYFLQADFNHDNNQEFSITFKNTTDQIISLMIDTQANLLKGFPVTFSAKSLSVPSITDLDNNGFLDLIIGTENGFKTIAYNGSLICQDFQLANADSTGIAGGILPLTINNKIYLLGIIGHNRMALWDSKGKMQNGYPITFPEPIISYPTLYAENDSVFAYVSTKNGHIYRQYLNACNPIDWNIPEYNPWRSSFGDYSRSASWNEALPENQITTNELFISSQCYIYPNPWLNIFNNKITIQAMLNKTENVKVSVYDIAGNLIYSKTDTCNAYIPNNTSFILNPNKMSSGVYFVIMETKNKAKRLKFAIEK